MNRLEKLKEAKSIIDQYAQKCSTIDEGNLYFAATQFEFACAEYEKIIAELEWALKDCNYFCQDQKSNANEAINTICQNEECDYQCNGCIKSISDCETTSITIKNALQKLKEFRE